MKKSLVCGAHALLTALSWDFLLLLAEEGDFPSDTKH